MKHALTTSIILLIALIVQFSAVNAEMRVIEYNNTNGVGDSATAHFFVQTLKYEPYPVSGGDWFDVWIKVQNTGSDDANNAQFELIPAYPFSSNDSLVRKYGAVPGTATAFRNKQLGDTDIQSNQVIMKFRVKVAESAPSGESMLKLQVTSDRDSGYIYRYDLPIEVGKTNTDFDVSMQSLNSLGSSFMITNIGAAAANTLIVKVADQGEWQPSQGDTTYTLGRLDTGDSTRFTIQNAPKSGNNQVHLLISYTDAAGTRREVNRVVSVVAQGSSSSTTDLDKPYVKWVFTLIGIVVGIIITALSRKIHRTKRK